MMLLSYLLAEQLTLGAAGTNATAARVVDEALVRTQPAHQALWGQLGRSERVVLGAVADGVAPPAARWRRSISSRAARSTWPRSGSPIRVTSCASASARG